MSAVLHDGQQQHGTDGIIYKLTRIPRAKWTCQINISTSHTVLTAIFQVNLAEPVAPLIFPLHLLLYRASSWDRPRPSHPSRHTLTTSSSDHPRLVPSTSIVTQCFINLTSFTFSTRPNHLKQSLSPHVRLISCETTTAHHSEINKSTINGFKLQIKSNIV